MNTYLYANNNPVGIAFGGLCIGGSTTGTMAAYSGLGAGAAANGVANNGLSVKFPAINAITLAIDFTASMAGALSVLRWTATNPSFYEDLIMAGVSKSQMLFGLKTPFSVASYLLLGYDVFVDVWSHIRAGDPWQTTVSSALVTTGVGALNIWAASEVGAAIGGMIGGVPGFIVGTVAGVLVGVVINGIFYTEFNGKSIAGHIEDGIEYIFDALF